MTTPDPVARRRRHVRVGAITAALLTPLAVAGTGLGVGTAAPAAPALSPVSAARAATTYRPAVPFVARPLDPAASRDLRTFAPRRKGTDFTARCGTPVLAAHPGTARVITNQPWGGPHLVKIITGKGNLYTTYAYMRSTTVATGQLIQAGQQIGEVGDEGRATRCSLQFRVRNNATRTTYDPTRWLSRHVGRVTPSAGLYGDGGINIATFNVLGASHTARGGNKASWPDYGKRLPKQIAMLEAAKADVVGLQEFQRRQRALFVKLAGKTWGVYPSSTKPDPENSIIYRKSKFTLLEGRTFAVPYFNGHVRQMPYVLLQDKETGRTAYVINVHNPASTSRYPNQGKWRQAALARERQLIIDLRAHGRPVFLTGDFNDREKAFCGITAGKLAISPDSVPSMECAYPPKYYWVDWIFAAGQARFTTLSVDTSTRPKGISDHPLVVARTHLAD
jgi:endonuclease/exonuclease/phosphatase family metal-dependent hydrolase